MLHRYGKLGPFMAVMFVAVAGTVMGAITMPLWNALLPELFGLPMISFVQAIGILILSRIIFGGSHGHNRWRHHDHDSHWSSKWWHDKHEHRDESQDDVVADEGD